MPLCFRGLLANRLRSVLASAHPPLPAGTNAPNLHPSPSEPTRATPRSAAICAALTLGSKIASWAPLSSRSRQMRMAGVSRRRCVCPSLCQTAPCNQGADAVLLPGVEIHHLLPGGGYLVQAVVAAENHQVEDVFLEAATTNAGGFAEGGDAVDGAGGVCSGWARKALAVSLESSLLHRFVRRIWSRCAGRSQCQCARARCRHRGVRPCWPRLW